MNQNGLGGYDMSDLRYIHPAVVGGIETATLDNGPERGVRVAWVNTGSPLRYKVLIDRGLDIAEAFFAEKCLSFLSFTGAVAPSPARNVGMEWLTGFYGGLLCSCGPQHVGAPGSAGGIDYGLHGTHSNTPAELEMICQPDPAWGINAMSLTGTVRTARMFGPNIEMRRTIRSVLGEPMIHVHDSFLNRGNTPAPHCWLLHINPGWPLLDVGARLVYRGEVTARPDSVESFTDPAVYKRVPPALDAHRGRGEAVAFIDPATDAEGLCHAGVANEPLGLALEIVFRKSEFPRLTNWQHFGPAGEYVVGLEPISGGMGCGVDPGVLAPGQTRSYECTLRVLDDRQVISQFIADWG